MGLFADYELFAIHRGQKKGRKLQRAEAARASEKDEERAGRRRDKQLAAALAAPTAAAPESSTTTWPVTSAGGSRASLTPQNRRRWLPSLPRFFPLSVMGLANQAFGEGGESCCPTGRRLAGHPLGFDCPRLLGQRP